MQKIKRMIPKWQVTRFTNEPKKSNNAYLMVGQ